MFAMDNALREIGGTVLDCNWLQCMENSLDPVHTEWLHRYFTNYVLEAKYGIEPLPQMPGHSKIGFDRFEHGIWKRRVVEGKTEEWDRWSVGHPIIFPDKLRHTSTFQIRVPSTTPTPGTCGTRQYARACLSSCETPSHTTPCPPLTRTASRWWR